MLQWFRVRGASANVCLQIPGIFTLGPTIGYEVGFSTTLEGTAELSYGVLAKVRPPPALPLCLSVLTDIHMYVQISNDATIRADLINTKNSAFRGWEPIIQQIPFKLNAAAKATVTAFSQPVLALKIEVIGLPAYQAALKMKLPQLTATLSAVSSTSGTGVCGDKSKSTGVQVGADIGVDMTFRVGEDSPTDANTLYQTQLFVSCPNAVEGECVMEADLLVVRLGREQTPVRHLRRAVLSDLCWTCVYTCRYSGLVCRRSGDGGDGGGGCGGCREISIYQYKPNPNSVHVVIPACVPVPTCTQTRLRQPLARGGRGSG